MRNIIILSYFSAFYKLGLEIPEADLHSMSWEAVVERMSEVASTLPESAYRPVLHVDAKDIAHRIMRQDNYLIALVNKDILRLEESKKFRLWPVLTVLMEWTIRICILNYVFDSRHNMRKAFLSEQYRYSLAAGLKRRFFLAGILTAICAPITLTWMVMYGMFKYGEEIYRRPASLSFRRYTPFAQWKIREYNELENEFRKRLRKSYIPAARYLDEFPNPVLAICASFVTYLSGAVFIVLTIATMINGDLLMNFELTEGKAVFFYLSIFGTLAAVSRGMIPAETQVPNPRRHLRRVIRYIHYHPPHWRHKYHSSQVRSEFSAMYQFRTLNFLCEILGVFLTPWYCFHAFSDNAEGVINFFREFTRYNERVGYVCSFADFKFGQEANRPQVGLPRMHDTKQNVLTNHDYVQPQSDIVRPEEGPIPIDAKMEQSFLTFRKNNSRWEPIDDPGNDVHQNLAMSRMQRSHRQLRGQYTSSSGSDTTSESTSSSRSRGRRRRRREKQREVPWTRMGQSRIINHVKEEELEGTAVPSYDQRAAEGLLEPVSLSSHPDGSAIPAGNNPLRSPQTHQLVPIASTSTTPNIPVSTQPLARPLGGQSQADVAKDPTHGIPVPSNKPDERRRTEDDALELLWDGKS